MLSEEAQERLSERLVRRIQVLNDYFIEKLGNQLIDIGEMTPSQYRVLMQSIEFGANLDDIANEIANITDMNIRDIYDIFEEIARTNQEWAEKFYKYRDKPFIPYDENIALQNQVKAIARVTANEYMNIANTTTIGFVTKDMDGNVIFKGLKDTYIRATDEAILSVSQGRENYTSAIDRIVKELSHSGLNTVDYASGYHRRLDSAVRMNIMDGIRSINRETLEQFGREFEADGYEVSHHKNPAHDHSNTDKLGHYDIDGKQFSIDEFSKVNESLNRHVGEMNCYHYKFPIILGVSEPMYTKDQLKADKEANMKGFEFEGKHYTNYEGTQLQRRLETEIRKAREKQMWEKKNYEATGNKDALIKSQKRINQLTKKYNELCTVSKLPYKIDRLRVHGYKRISTK